MSARTSSFELDAKAANDELGVRALVMRAKSGDSDALGCLYSRYRNYVFLCVRRIVRDEHEAEDITQEVFLKLLTVLGKYEERQVPFRRWVARLAHNAAVDHIRARTPTPYEDLQTTLGDGAISMAFDPKSLHDSIGTLPEDQKAVVVLRHIVGLSPSEIANILGRTESSVHGLHHRGRLALQEQLSLRNAAPVTLTCRTQVAD